MANMAHAERISCSRCVKTKTLFLRRLLRVIRARDLVKQGLGGLYVRQNVRTKEPLGLAE